MDQPHHANGTAPPFHWLRPGGLRAVFQPIYAVHNGCSRPVAAEGLTRGPEDTVFECPLVLFAAAREAGDVARLDKACITAILDAARDLPVVLDVFVNVHPATLCNDCGFPAFLAAAASRAGIAPGRIVLEVLEYARVADRQCSQLHAALTVLRDLGVRVAVDDVGSITEEARRALAFNPHYIKLDADLVIGARGDLRRRAMVHAIVELGRAAGAQVIAEGVEVPADLELVLAAGISLAQGYMLCRPVPAIVLAEAVDATRFRVAGRGR